MRSVTGRWAQLSAAEEPWFADSALEGAVMSEPVSAPQIPC
jgi:hypothetical protein